MTWYFVGLEDAPPRWAFVDYYEARNHAMALNHEFKDRNYVLTEHDFAIDRRCKYLESCGAQPEDR